MQINLARATLFGVAALVVVAVVGAIGITSRERLAEIFSGQKQAPTVLVMTPEMVEGTLELSTSEAQRRDEKAKAIAAVPRQPQSGPARSVGSLQNSTKDAVVGLDSTIEYQQADSMSLIKRAMNDTLSTALAQALQDSRRFRAISEQKAAESFASVRTSAKDAGPAQAPFKIGFASNTVTKRETAEAALGETIQPVDPRVDQVARNLGADYVLLVSVSEPRVVYTVIAPSAGINETRIIFKAQPVINCWLSSTHTREAIPVPIMLDHPIQQTVVANSARPLVADVSIAYDRVQTQVSEAVSRIVLAKLLETIAPARIIKAGDDLILNRGSNDGMRSGAVYEVKREVGEDLEDNGLSLGRERHTVGSIQINQVDDVKSTATMVSGGPFQRGDFVVMPIGNGAALSDQSPSGQTQDAAPLGAFAVDQAGGKASGHATIAVNGITSGGRVDWGFVQLVAGVLAQDPRVTIVSRAQTDSVMAERNLNAMSSGDYDNSGIQGMKSSDYLVSGTVSSSTSRHAKTVSVGGISEVVSVSAHTSASAALRVTRVDGVAGPSAIGAGSTPIEALQTAAHSLLLKLFPLTVVQLADGGNFVINRGRDAGLRAGLQLQVYHLGAPIYDHGQLISEGARVPIGQATVIDVQDTVSTARMESGSGPRITDVVEPASMATPNATNSVDAVSSAKAAANAVSNVREVVRRSARARTIRKAVFKSSADDGIHF